MRVLHLPFNIGGGTWRMVEAERRLGLESDLLTFRDTFQGMDVGGISLGFDGLSHPRRILARLAGFLRFANRYDVFHFYWGESFLQAQHLGVNHWDFPLLSALGKTIVMTFQGCDVRQKGRFLEEFDLSVCSSCREECSEKKDRRKAANVRRTNRYARAVFVSTPDLLSVVPGASVLPQPAPDVESLGDSYRPPPPGMPLRVLHSPSHREKKGTGYLLDAIDRLAGEGVELELVLNEGFSWKENMELMRSCHVVVDNLNGGWYGLVSVEAMAIGVPAICYIGEEPRSRVPYGDRMPILSADVNSIGAVLRECARDREMLVGRAREGPVFVERYHNLDELARTTARSYGFKEEGHQTVLENSATLSKAGR